MSKELQGCRVFVTGASSGIGRATATLFGAEGARVALVARTRGELEAAAAGIEGSLVLECDVRDPPAVEAAVGRAAGAFGGLDIVVTAAGVGKFGDTAEFATEDWDEVVDVGLRGTFLVIRAALPHVRRSKGHLITISSIAALRAFPGSAAYCAMKAGVRALAQVVAEENRRAGVRVTNMVVGSVDSPFWERAGGTELARERMLRPEDVARAIVVAAAQPRGVSVDEVILMPPDGVL